MRVFQRIAVVAVTATALIIPSVSPADAHDRAEPSASQLASGIRGANGSTVGPDGALYVTESETGSILRIDRHSGETTTYATGLPPKVAPIGGPMDIVFKGDTAFVLVSLVGEFFGNDHVNGIYRVDGPTEFTIIADLGQWALDNPPDADLDYFIPTGVHFAIENYRHGFAISDAHHNKLIHVRRKGQISLLANLGNIVPAGLERSGGRILTALSGPVPHLPEDGQIARYLPRIDDVEVIASGGPLMVDVERGRGGQLFGLAQGYFMPGQEAGAPAEPNTGKLLALDDDGGVTVVVDGLDRPVTFEVRGDTAYVVGLGGDVVRVVGITPARDD